MAGRRGRGEVRQGPAARWGTARGGEQGAAESGFSARVTQARAAAGIQRSPPNAAFVLRAKRSWGQAAAPWHPGRTRAPRPCALASLLRCLLTFSAITSFRRTAQGQRPRWLLSIISSALLSAVLQTRTATGKPPPQGVRPPGCRGASFLDIKGVLAWRSALAILPRVPEFLGAGRSLQAGHAGCLIWTRLPSEGGEGLWLYSGTTLPERTGSQRALDFRAEVLTRQARVEQI